MLNALRKSSKGWLAKVLLGLLVASFAVWGIADVFRAVGQNALITVGDSEISAQAFRQSLDREVQAVSRQVGQPITLAQARQFGLDGQVLGRLVTEALLNESARDLGLGASDRAVAVTIAEDPAFQGADGTFDRAYFGQLLRANGLSEEEFIDQQRGAALRQQLVAGLVGATPVPDILSEALGRYQNGTRSIEYLLLEPTLIGEIPDPAEDVLAAFFEERKTQYRAPEYRELRLVTLDASALAGTIEVPEEELRQAYEADEEAYLEPETRGIDQIMFPNAEEAQAAYQSIQDGGTFEALAAARNLPPGDYRLGTIPASGIVDPAIREAAFALQPDTVSEPVQGRFGTALLRVTEIVPETRRPFEEAREEIREKLATDRAHGQLLDAFDAIEDARAGGATLAEAAQAQGLEPREIEAVDAEGNAPDGTTVQLEDSASVLETAFETETGIMSDPVNLGQDGYAWLEVVEVTPERERPLDEVRAQVVEDWRAAELDDRLDAMAQEIAQAARNGQALQEAAASRGLELRQAGPFKRSDQPEPLAAAAVSSVFATVEGGVGSAPAATAPGRVVFRVTEVTLPPEVEAAEADQLNEQLSRGLADDLLTQYVNRMRDTLGVTVDQTELDRALGQS